MRPLQVRFRASFPGRSTSRSWSDLPVLPWDSPLGPSRPPPWLTVWFPGPSSSALSPSTPCGLRRLGALESCVAATAACRFRLPTLLGFSTLRSRGFVPASNSLVPQRSLLTTARTIVRGRTSRQVGRRPKRAVFRGKTGCSSKARASTRLAWKAQFAASFLDARERSRASRHAPDRAYDRDVHRSSTRYSLLRRDRSALGVDWVWRGVEKPWLGAPLAPRERPLQPECRGPTTAARRT
jgi:hypothetical protein